MPRGGKRAGAGRKPKTAVLEFLTGKSSRRERPVGAATATPSGEAPMVVPPRELSQDERAIWDEWAPHAHQAKTLTDATVGNFILLVMLEIDRRSLRRSFIGDDGRGLFSESAMAARRGHLALLREIRSIMKDFCLAPFGKEVLGSPEPEDDPLDDFTRTPRWR